MEAAELIERTGREALTELRQLFGAVRRGEGEDLSGPPSLGRVDELVHRARDAGLPVELRVEGDAVALPPGVDLAAYRIVQEALTNTFKHAGRARASVTVAYEPTRWCSTIEDDGAGAREATTSATSAAATASWACASARRSTAASCRRARAAAAASRCAPGSTRRSSGAGCRCRAEEVPA